MPQSIDRVRGWVKYWSWVSAHGWHRECDTELWWSLAILRHRRCVDLTLAVCNPIETSGSRVTNTRRQVAYEKLGRARDYDELVSALDAEVRTLFAEAGATPPSLLPNGQLGCGS